MDVFVHGPFSFAAEYINALVKPLHGAIENAWLSADGEPGPLDDLIGHSITYRIAIGPRAGQKLLALQTVPAGQEVDDQQGDHRGAARAGGFSLHAGIDIAPGQKQKLERLCRYVSRPPVAVERMALTSSGHVRYTLKAPCRDGTSHIVLEPVDLLARLAALVPPPRMHLTRFHGVFASHSKLRAAVTPAHRGVGAPKQPVASAYDENPPTPRHVAMNWARRLKRVFGIDIEACVRCGGKLAIIASIDETAMEWQQDYKAPIPDLLLQELSKDLFTSRQTESVRHPAEDAMGAVLGAASSLKLNIPGVGTAMMNRKDLRSLRNKSA